MVCFAPPMARTMAAVQPPLGEKNVSTSPGCTGRCSHEPAPGDHAAKAPAPTTASASNVLGREERIDSVHEIHEKHERERFSRSRQRVARFIVSAASSFVI